MLWLRHLLLMPDAGATRFQGPVSSSYDFHCLDWQISGQEKCQERASPALHEHHLGAFWAYGYKADRCSGQFFDAPQVSAGSFR